MTDAANAEIVRQMKLAQSGVIQQGTPEWFAMRCGKVTASKIADMLAKPKVPGRGMRANYLWQLALERVNGKVAEAYSSEIMKEAHIWEPFARNYYSFVCGHEVEQVAFVDHPSIPLAGCSPDGFVLKDGKRIGLVEIKCPIDATHGQYIKAGLDGIDTEYVKQMQFQMASTGMPFCDFVSYNHNMPEHRRGLIIRVERDEAMIGEIEAAVKTFQVEIDALADWLRAP